MEPELTTELSTHLVEVVPIKLYPHGNADSLSIVYPFGEDGYTVVVKTEEWKDRTMGAYIPPDSIVPDVPEFAFLGGHRHIKVRRYRGILSQGLMWKAPEGSQIGDNVAALLGVTHYNPPEPVGSTGKAPRLHGRRNYPNSIRGWVRYLWFRLLNSLGFVRHNLMGGANLEVGYMAPRYDVDSFFRYPHILKDGEEVIAHEKVDGSSGRWVYIDDVYYAGSHNEWKQEGGNAWWEMYSKYPDLKRFVKDHPGVVVYGEIYGLSVQKDMPYNLTAGDVRLRVFDLWEAGYYFDHDDAFAAIVEYNIPWAPELYRGPFDAKKLVELGTSFMSKVALDVSSTKIWLAEGLVVRPVHERYEYDCGRVILKIVSPEYMDEHGGGKKKKQPKKEQPNA